MAEASLTNTLHKSYQSIAGTPTSKSSQSLLSTSSTATSSSNATFDPFPYTSISLSTLKRKDARKWTFVALVIITATVLLSIFHNRIVELLDPFVVKISNLPFGWVIPIVALIIISFPPLLGHELITILCGLVWGLWPGFGIVITGTLLGEIVVFFVIKHFCTGWAQRMQSSDINYGTMARVIRDGGLYILVLVRFSLIPGHLSTIVFSTCGVSFKTYLISAIVTLPKQLIVVYIGTQFSDDADESPISIRVIGDIVVAIAFIFTIFAGWVVQKRTRRIRGHVLDEMRSKRVKDRRCVV